jgi:threonylcarbamoyladenosine tRNA methylthiotransferase MtaB
VPIEIVLSRVNQAVRSGFKEIVLSGVHLGSYGRDLETPLSLVTLLQALAEYAESRRAESDILFRLSSLEPMDCSSEVVDLVAERSCFAPHFHLPLQHASDRILAQMRRPYSIDQYAQLISGIRKRIPLASLGSDIIVGFPGEADDDFAELMAFLSFAPLTYLHVFPYSDRPGTVAAGLPCKVHGATIRERARRVREAGGTLVRRFHSEQIDTVQKALTLDDGTLAVTGNYLKVRIPPGIPRNEWVWLRIASSDGSLTGTPIAADITGGRRSMPGAVPETGADLRR